MRRFFLKALPALVVGLLPLAAMGSDQETAQKIAQELRGSGRLHDYSIGVTFENGKAQLVGRVANQEQARTAIEMAEQLPYVTKVENRLEIKPSAKHDTAVEKVGYNDGSSRRTASRDDALFGSTASQGSPLQRVAAEEPIDVPAPVVPRTAMKKPQPAAARQMNHTASMNQGRVGAPIPSAMPASSGVAQRVAYDQPNMPCYAWPSYAAHPNYAGVTYPNQYSASAWPYIGPFYPYPQVPLGWRKVTMEWKDGWWWLDFNDHCRTFRR
jgi:hypothetical protein